MRHAFPPLRLFTLLTALLASGCAGFGHERLQHDQVDYGRALDRAQKQQTLLNMINLRYADAPSFLPVTQIIAGYSYNGSTNASVATTTAGHSPLNAAMGGTLGFASNPTFTFTPVSGEEFAASYIRPLAPALVLPLMQSGVPVDLLLRIVVQSIGNLQNSNALAGDTNSSSGSLDFFRLINALRRLQIQGALTLRFQKAPEEGKTEDANRVFLAVDPAHSGDAAVAADAKLARSLLRMPDSAKEIEIVYGAVPEPGARVGVVTRSVIGILTELGAQIDVPDADVAHHATVPTVRLLEPETRPAIVVHVGSTAPADAFVDVLSDGLHYWIERNDFESKFAFSVVQELIALAQASQSGKTPIVTIPAG